MCQKGIFVGNQSFCGQRKFKIICGVWTSRTPAFLCILFKRSQVQVSLKISKRYNIFRLTSRVSAQPNYQISSEPYCPKIIHCSKTKSIIGLICALAIDWGKEHKLSDSVVAREGGGAVAGCCKPVVASPACHHCLLEQYLFVSNEDCVDEYYCADEIGLHPLWIVLWFIDEVLFHV